MKGISQASSFLSKTIDGCLSLRIKPVQKQAPEYEEVKQEQTSEPPTYKQDAIVVSTLQEFSIESLQRSKEINADF